MTRYLDGFLHEKVMLVDHSVSTVGTANFDNRSFRLNFEITSVIADTVFAGEMERMFNADFAKSRLMEKGEYDAKPWWFRFAVRVARLTSPVQ
jgi:cardiolipin synthase